MSVSNDILPKKGPIANLPLLFLLLQYDRPILFYRRAIALIELRRYFFVFANLDSFFSLKSQERSWMDLIGFDEKVSTLQILLFSTIYFVPRRNLRRVSRFIFQIDQLISSLIFSLLEYLLKLWYFGNPFILQVCSNPLYLTLQSQAQSWSWLLLQGNYGKIPIHRKIRTCGLLWWCGVLKLRDETPEHCLCRTVDFRGGVPKCRV